MKNSSLEPCVSAQAASGRSLSCLPLLSTWDLRSRSSKDVQRATPSLSWRSHSPPSGGEEWSPTYPRPYLPSCDAAPSGHVDAPCRHWSPTL